MTDDLPHPENESKLISLPQLQEGHIQDQKLLNELGKVVKDIENRRSSRRIFIVLYVLLSLSAFLGTPLSAFTGLLLLAFALPKILRDTEPENAEAVKISYSLETSQSASDNVATRFEQMSEACQSLARSDAFFLRQPLAKASIRRAVEIQINNLNSKPWCIGDDKSMLYFFPNHIVIRQVTSHALLPYNALRVTLQSHIAIPAVDNPALITFIAPQGPFFELLVSNAAMAERFCNAINC